MDGVPIPPDELVLPTDLVPVHRFIRIIGLATALGVPFVLVVNGFFVEEPVLYWLVPVLLVHVCSLIVASRVLARGRVRQALAIVIASATATSLAVPVFIPFLWPVMVLTVLSPLMLATPYLPPRALAMMVAAGVLAVGAVSAVGLLNEDGGAIPDFSDSSRYALVIFSITLQVTPLCYVLVWLNNSSLRSASERASALTRDLQASQVELARSRRRIVSSADVERSRIERDLHDGAQQRLTALALRLRQLETQPEIVAEPAAQATVHTLVDELDAAIEDLRELAHGIYPPLLRLRGLPEAIRSVIRRSPRTIELDDEGVGRYDPSIETALYFVVMEGLANAAKHAPDAVSTVRLREADGFVFLELGDDGPGFDSTVASTSTGLLNMADRIAAIGGTLEVDTEPGQGTRILAIVPVDPTT